MIRIELQSGLWKIREGRNDSDVHSNVGWSVVSNEKNFEWPNRPRKAAVPVGFMDGDPIATDLKGKQHVVSL